MARRALPPLCGALENFTLNAFLHTSFYARRIADPENRSRLTRHDFAYVIFPRVHQRAPLSTRLPSTPRFGAPPLIYHLCQCRASAAAPGAGNPTHWYVMGQPARHGTIPTHLLLGVGFPMQTAVLGPKPSRQQRTACERDAVVLSAEEHAAAIAVLRQRKQRVSV